MFSQTIGVSIAIPFRLALAGVGVTGKSGGSSAGDINVKIANKDSADWEALTVSTHFTINELSEGDYTLTILAAVNDTEGHLRVKIWDNNSEATFETKQYVINIREKKSSKFENAVYADYTNGTESTNFPYGTIKFPTKKFADANTIADANYLNTIFIQKDETLSTNPVVNTKRIKGEGLPAFGVNSARFNNCILENLYLNSGTFNSSSESNIFKTCVILGLTLPNKSHFIDCIFASSNAFSFNDPYYSHLLNCSFRNNAKYSANGSGDIYFTNCGGDLEIQNLTVGTIYLFGFNGDLTLAASCTGGTINIIGGSGKITDNSAGTTVNQNGFSIGAGDATLAKQDAILANTGATGALVSDINITTQGNATGIYNNGVDINQVKSDVAVVDANIDVMGVTVTAIDSKVDIIDTNVDDVLADTADMQPRVVSIESDTLKRDTYVDFLNKTVVTRNATGDPSQYEVGTGGNKEIIDVTHVAVGVIEKADTETVQ